MEDNKKCRDCRFIDIKRKQTGHHSHYCTNENVVGSIDVNSPACEYFEERHVPTMYSFDAPMRKAA